MRDFIPLEQWLRLHPRAQEILRRLLQSKPENEQAPPNMESPQGAMGMYFCKSYRAQETFKFYQNFQVPEWF